MFLADVAAWQQAYESVKPRVLDIVEEVIGECINPPDPRSAHTPLDRSGPHAA